MLRFCHLLLPLFAVAAAIPCQGDSNLSAEPPDSKSVDYSNRDEVRPVIEQVLETPAAEPKVTAHYYSRGTAYFDGFIPCAGDMVQNPRPEQQHYRYIVHDGRVVKCDFFDDTDRLSRYLIVRHNERGAPLLTVSYDGNGTRVWYKYAAYDEAGRVSAIYCFNARFDLQSHDEFTYRQDDLTIRSISKGGELLLETRYENGGIFVILNGIRKRVNNGTRQQAIRSPVRLGLKPYYPGTDKPE